MRQLGCTDSDPPLKSLVSARGVQKYPRAEEHLLQLPVIICTSLVIRATPRGLDTDKFWNGTPAVPLPPTPSRDCAPLWDKPGVRMAPCAKGRSVTGADRCVGGSRH
ncbi:hypothetical protein SKAU_G00215750 [Synaphobranchus kaupii]|uniref:Uncharacterized protein n=1 Tax=Synaphobranchus kaupii TaxID=118154 RepID=A0A9Q1F9T0_SYNKA|nr:hypothetical protein SKAU_G00215750 [Synaphobranchus kaupii]